MATRTSTQQVCDRCEKAFDEVSAEASTTKSVSRKEPYKLLSGDHVVLTFQDLCERCDRVVDELVKRLTLTSEPKPKAAKVEEKAAEAA